MVFVAAFGLTFISNFLIGHQFWLRLAGGTLLCILGTRTLIAFPPREARPAPVGKTIRRHVHFHVFLTLTNPMNAWATPHRRRAGRGRDDDRDPINNVDNRGLTPSSTPAAGDPGR